MIAFKPMYEACFTIPLSIRIVCLSLSIICPTISMDSKHHKNASQGKYSVPLSHVIHVKPAPNKEKQKAEIASLPSEDPPAIEPHNHQPVVKVGPRMSRCKKFLCCNGLILIAGLVVTTGAIAYYLGVYEPPVLQIRDSLQAIETIGVQGIVVAKQGIVVAQNALNLVQATTPELVNYLNATKSTCQQASTVCDNAYLSCNKVPPEEGR